MPGRPISFASRVDALPLIGEVRAEALAKIGIYSVSDFISRTAKADGILAVSSVTDLSVQEIEKIRAAAPPQAPRHFRTALRKTGAIIAVLIGIALIGGGLVVEFNAFNISAWPSAHVLVLHADAPGTLTSIRAVVSSRVRATDLMETEVVVKSHSSGGIPARAVPKSVIVHGLRKDARLASTRSRVTLLQRQLHSTEFPGWVRETEVARQVVHARLRLTTLRKNETISGRHIVAKVFPPPLPEKISTVETETVFTFHDQLDTKWIDEFRDGVVAVTMSSSAATARPGKGIVQHTYGALRLPAYRFDMGPREPIALESTWGADWNGGFEAPEDLVGAKQFWSGDSTVHESFRYRVRGAKWLAFVAQIVGLPFVGLTAFILRKR